MLGDLPVTSTAESDIFTFVHWGSLSAFVNERVGPGDI